MTLLFVRPGVAMRVTSSQPGLYAPVASSSFPSSAGGATASLATLATNLVGWWDASSPANLLGANNTPVGVWNAPGEVLLDLSGNQTTLTGYRNGTNGNQAQVCSHLSGLLGGAGYPTTMPGLLQPALDPGAGWQLPSSTLSTKAAWTLYLVWSRPNWRQGSSADSNPITLLTIGSTPVLQIDSSGGNRLVLFPGITQTVLSSAMTRRHTHCIVLRFAPGAGFDLWLDQTQLAEAVAPPGGVLSGIPLLLHDGTQLGAAQCWLHEAAVWSQALANTAVSSVVSYATRWALGARKGIYFLFNGQSNAINYTEVDGAAALLAQGVAWYLGALAYNVLATTTNASNYTMASGHGIYDVASAGYPGSFVQDPGDGSDPSTWSLGADGLATQQAIEDLPAEDVADMAVIVWPWNETDSLRQYSEISTFEAAALRLLGLLRPMVGDTSNHIPLVWWNAIPYGTNGGITMHRQAVQALVANRAANVVVGNSQTSDSNPRGSTWDPTTGVASGGDPAHRDSLDNLRFAVLAAPVVARALLASGFRDSITAVPNVLPRTGGPTMTYAWLNTPTTVVITIEHDAGDDLVVPLQAAAGVGFAVMDGGSLANPGSIIDATACERMDATHLQVTLASPPQNAPSACLLFYPYGPTQIGRGNAVTDNFASLTMPAGWAAGTELGSSWAVNCPLAATFTGLPLSATSD